MALWILSHPFSRRPPRYWGLPHRFTVLAAISLLWIALGSIPLYGMSKTPAAGWAWVREVFASSPGTLTDLGVICLVAASQVRVRLPMSEEVPMPEDKVTKFVMFGVSLLLPVLPLAAGRYGRDLGVLKALLLYAQLSLANCVACLFVIACEFRRWGIGVDIAELLPAATLAKSLVVKALSPFPPAAPVSGRRFEGALLHGLSVVHGNYSRSAFYSALGTGGGDGGGDLASGNEVVSLWSVLATVTFVAAAYKLQKNRKVTLFQVSDWLQPVQFLALLAWILGVVSSKALTLSDGRGLLTWILVPVAMGLLFKAFAAWESWELGSSETDAWAGVAAGVLCVVAAATGCVGSAFGWLIVCRLIYKLYRSVCSAIMTRRMLEKLEQEGVPSMYARF
ncbi:hypothetical protein SELMODRAFT_423037 [Selaginella moellendorffii]|uniref:Uncharacterized protein n=1 Tax=Selaginella moellendorffii TaxID=88036 RepID=D8SKD0_SELML|nr:hypothetical protein SELMODRAFT_423037 [Selaginella moellendorffii]